jgi:hypothetical protein
VWVLQLRGDANLPQESIGANHCRQLRTQHLHRDLAVVLQVGGEEDDRHATLSELALESIALGEVRLELLEETGH